MSISCPGYTGIALLDETKFRCSDCSLSADQEPLFYDHVYGLNDSGTGSGTKGETVGTIQIQKKIWRPSPVKITGTLAYPATENSPTFFSHAKTGTYFDFEFQYYNGNSRNFKDCRINSLTLDITAGDILNISADIWALSLEETASVETYTTAEKFITWDKCSVSGISGSIQAFNLNINNNLKYVYTVNTGGEVDGLAPNDLRVGMQLVTGTITSYFDDGLEYITPSSTSTTITFGCVPLGLSIEIDAVLRPNQLKPAIGPVMVTIPFVGVGKALGA